MKNDTDLPRTRSAIQIGIGERLHLGCQLHASIPGRVVGDFAVGEVRPGEPLRTNHLMLWLSATKPLAAIAIGQLWEKGLLEIDDPVSRHVPEFAARGKEAVTIRHLLTHTAGFRGLAASWTPLPWDEILSRICAGPLEPGWVPGHKAGYHVASSWYVLGEIVRRLSTTDYCQYVRLNIFEPLGVTDSFVGIPPDLLPTYRDRLAPMYDTTKGEWDNSYAGNSDPSITSCRPGAGGRGPVRDLARIYETLLNRGPLLRPQTVEALTARHRTGLYDHTFRHVIDWGLGFIVNSPMYGVGTVPYGYGPHASTRTFGHGGSQSSVAFADPEAGLACAVAFNGMPGEANHDRRLRAVLAALYEDLGLNEQNVRS